MRALPRTARTRTCAIVCAGLLLTSCSSSAETSSTPSPTPMLTSGPLYRYTPSLPPTATPTPLVYTEPTAPPQVLGDFTTNAPLSSAATWRSLTWRKLSVDDPLSAVRSVVRWRGGYLAIGYEWTPDWTEIRTPVWVSSDGVSWRLLGPQVFGPTTVISGIVEVRGRLVAVGSAGGELGLDAGEIQAWTSTDGVAWNAESLPDLTPSGADSNRAPLVAVGPAGVVVAVERESSSADGTRSYGSTLAAVSADGKTWTPVGSSAFPYFSITGLWGRADGYIAVGSFGPETELTMGMALWSPDGTRWPAVQGTIVPAASDLETGTPFWGVSGIDAGSAGAIAYGGTNSAPNKTLWWQSSDGRNWAELPDYAPLGVDSAPRIGFPGPDGWLAADGTRLVALRLRTDPTAWVSFDAVSWSTLTMNGALPTGDSSRVPLPTVRVLPGGILFGYGETAWYGTAAK